MTILGTYKASSLAERPGVAPGVFNVIGYAPSGQMCSGTQSTDGIAGVILGVGLFLWSGAYTNGCWMPAKREWFNA
jgi:fructose-specific phosphotransferase system IIC component